MPAGALRASVGDRAAAVAVAGRWLLTLSTPDREEGQELYRDGLSSLRLTVQEPGRWPRASIGQGTVALFEGLLFNRVELASALSPAPEADDAELVRRAFERWGRGAAERLKGSYVLAYFDARRRLLFAVRDRAGAYPLFFRHRGGSLQLSNSPSLVASSDGRAQVDRHVIASLLARSALDIRETCFRGVERLPAGNLLTLDGSGLRIERYWRLPTTRHASRWMCQEEADTFPQQLERAVGRAWDGGRCGIFLSGGIDSVSVAVAAAGHCQRIGFEKPLALSFIFPQRLREEAVQRGVAKELGLPQLHLEYAEVAGNEGLLSKSLALSASLEAPLQNIWLPAYLRLAKAGADAGCTTILTGRGGDEWLTMFPIVAADLIRSLEVRELFAHTAALSRASRLGRLRAVRSILWKGGARPLLSACYADLLDRLTPALRRRRADLAVRRRLTGRNAWLLPDPALRREVERRTRWSVDETLREAPLPEAGFRHRLVMEMFENPLFAPSFEETYEQGRLTGARHHDVYWDPDLIEFLYRVPPRILYAGGQTKGLVRSRLARRFPGLGFERQKKLVARGFVNEVLLAEAGAAWGALGGAKALASIGAVEPRGVDRFVREAVSGKDTRRLSEVWLLLRLESWVRPRV